MILLAHIAFVPVEELLAPLASGTAAATLIWLGSFTYTLRRQRSRTQ